MSSIYRSPRAFRRALNIYPPYWGTGISVDDVSEDFRRVVVRMRKRFYNSNAFGTHFGGSLYSMCDPFYVLTLVPQLGREYMVWDKAARIDFLTPGRGTVTAVFDWSEEQIEDIRARTAGGERYEPERSLEIVDEAGKAVARVHKTLYIRKKRD